MIFSKKGSTFVEAAVVMPLVILSIISLMYIFINLYQNASANATLYSSLCWEAGENSETYTFSKPDKGKVSTISDKKNVEGEVHYSQFSGGLLRHLPIKKVKGKNHIIIEENIIRKADYVLQ